MAQQKPSSRALQRQVDLTTAVCQERILTTHVRHVLGLVHLVADRLPFDDALDIYVRILRLTPEQARNVGSRVLAEIGRRSGVPGVDPAESSFDFDDEEDEPVPAGGTGRSDAVFARLRRRIRGRVHDDLRGQIDLSIARTEDALLETHVANALVFVKALADELGAAGAVELYLNTMLLPEGFADVVYNRALAVIADQVLPPVPHTGDSSADREPTRRAAALDEQR